MAVDRLLQAVGADAGVLALRDDEGGLEVRRAVGYGDVAAAWTRIPLDAGLPLSEAARRGEPDLPVDRQRPGWRRSRRRPSFPCSTRAWPPCRSSWGSGRWACWV